MGPNAGIPLGGFRRGNQSSPEGSRNPGPAFFLVGSQKLNHYSQYVEDFYINMTLYTEMELPGDRQSILHFFDRISKKFPAMNHFYNRDRQEYVLEEEKDGNRYRWSSTEAKRVNSGAVNPESVDDAIAQHEFVLEQVPYALSVSHLDCESLSLMYGFDFNYRGNHNDLLYEVLGMIPVFERLGKHPGVSLTSYEPSLQLALDADCQTQCRLTFEPRSTSRSIRTGDYQEEQLSVYFTVRRFGSLSNETAFAHTLQQLDRASRELVDGYLVENVLAPLHQAIVIK